MRKYPKPEGFVEATTGRVAVLIEKYHLHLNGKAPAYFFNADMLRQGQNPWREIEATEKMPASGSYDVHFKDGRWVKVGPMMTVFVSQVHADYLGVQPNFGN